MPSARSVDTRVRQDFTLFCEKGLDWVQGKSVKLRRGGGGKGGGCKATEF